MILGLGAYDELIKIEGEKVLASLPAMVAAGAHTLKEAVLKAASG